MKFGDRVIVEARLERHPGPQPKRGLMKQWRRFVYKTPREALFIGKRTLNDGQVSYFEDHTEYMPRDYFKAFVVVFNERERPVYALPEDVEPL